MEIIKIQPAEQRIVVLAEKVTEKRTASGIIMPEKTQEEKPGIGVIVAAGKGSKDNPMSYKVGDKVLFSKYAGLEVELNLTGNEATYKVMNQMDVMGVIEEVKQ